MKKMSGLKKILIVIGSVIALATGLNLYFQYQNHQEHMQLKTSFEERDNMRLTFVNQAMSFLQMELFDWMEELTP